MSERKDEFETLANSERRGLLPEFLDFLKHNKKWWLLPMVLVILGLGALVLLGGTALAPFIYTLF
jgi:hypothetical protein